ncbi:MAG: hypothetical protein DRJ03_11175, partial [Chloroflexi bacterium]
MNEENFKPNETRPQDTPNTAEMETVENIVMVPIEKINVPRERVTSVWSPELEEEFLESIKTKGILKPLDLMEVEGELWLVDGLHRLLAAEKLGIPKVPARIKKGSIETLLIENIIVNRQRGKSNPAQEAECLAFLVYKRRFPLENAAKQLGLSPSWAKKLLKISTLPDEIKDLIKHGKIPVTGAFYIADLPSATEQIQLARDAANWNYSVEQIKARVAQLLNPDLEPQQGSYTFTSNGKPQKIPLRCRYCGKELPDYGKQYIWICTECEQLAADLIQSYKQALTQIQQQKQPAQPEPAEGPRETHTP